MRNSLFSLIILLSFLQCSTQKQDKKYSITIYYTTFDSASSAVSYRGQKLKYSYEEFNDDSNIIYQERYSTPDFHGCKIGEVLERSRFYYSRKEKTKSEKEFGICFPDRERGRGKGRVVHTYKYEKGLLKQVFSNGQLTEEYKYSPQDELIETKKINDWPDKADYVRNDYRNGLKQKSTTYSSDTVYSVDSFIYDSGNRLIEEISFNAAGEKVARVVYIYNSQGQVSEEKWRDPFTGWRMRSDGSLIEGEFYQINRYFYNTRGLVTKMEFWDLGKLMAVYTFEYQEN